MKSERRHELQQNELADALGAGINRLAPYGRAIAIGVVGLIAILFVYQFSTMQDQAQKSSATLDYLLATSNEDPETFQRVSQSFSNTQPGLWAQQAEADHHLAAGLEALYIDRNEANDFINTAIEGYKNILTSVSEPLLATRANLGLAKAQEAAGKLDEAVESYKKVAASTGSEVLAKQAADRIKALQSEDVKEFYAWFKENQPVSMPTESPTLPGLGDIPEDPTVDLPPLQTPVDVIDLDASDAETSDSEEDPSNTDEDDPSAKEPATNE